MNANLCRCVLFADDVPFILLQRVAMCSVLGQGKGVGPLWECHLHMPCTSCIVFMYLMLDGRRPHARYLSGGTLGTDLASPRTERCVLVSTTNPELEAQVAEPESFHYTHLPRLV